MIGKVLGIARRYGHSGAMAGAASLPMLAIVVVRVMAPAVGPSAASASEITDPEPPPLIQWDDDGEVESPMVTYLSTADAKVFGTSPMVPAQDPTEVRVDEDPGSIQNNNTDSFVLSSVLAGRRPIAVVNGVAYQQGASLGGGWQLEWIDTDQMRVILRHRVYGRTTLVWKPEKP